MGAPTTAGNLAFTFEELKLREALIADSTPAEHPLVLLPNDTVYLWRTFGELNYLYQMISSIVEGRIAYSDAYVYNHQVPKVPVIRGGYYDVRELIPATNWYIHLFEVPYRHPTYGSIAAWSTGFEFDL